MVPKISIVTVVYNNEKGIKETLDSVFFQTFPREKLEYIVIDGNSTDGTKDIIESNLDKIDFYLSEKDKGIYDAMNKGIAHATGEYIIFMNSGDSFYSEDVLSVVFNNENFEEADLIFGSAFVHSSWGDFEFHLSQKHKIWKSFSHQAVFVKTELMKTYPFDLSYKSAADFNFIFHMYSEKKSIKIVDTIIANIEYVDSGFTATHEILSKKEELKSVIQFSKKRIYIRPLIYHLWTLMKKKLTITLKKICPDLIRKLKKARDCNE